MNESAPEHYVPQDDSGIECIKAIRAMLGEEGYKAHLRACIVKYAWRCTRKDNTLSDMNKIMVYTQMLKDEVEGENYDEMLKTVEAEGDLVNEGFEPPYAEPSEPSSRLANLFGKK